MERKQKDHENKLLEDLVLYPAFSAAFRYGGLVYGIANAVGPEPAFGKILMGGLCYVGSVIADKIASREESWSDLREATEELYGRLTKGANPQPAAKNE